MTTEPTPYVPFTAQQGFESYEIPAFDEHVTAHLAPHLWRWCRQRLGGPPGLLDRMSLRMRLALGPRPMDRLAALVNDKPDMILNITHWLVTEAELPWQPLRELDQILSDGGSAWTADLGTRTLRRRMTRVEEESFRAAVAPADEAAEHLKEAWDAAWRRTDPSAVEAYSAAVKGIEDILTPIVIPKNSEPTLGKIISALKDKPEKWHTRLRGAETVAALIGMLDEIWKTDSRHAGMPPNSLEQAQDAVTIAVAVVALVRRGFLTRVDDP